MRDGDRSRCRRWLFPWMMVLLIAPGAARGGSAHFPALRALVERHGTNVPLTDASIRRVAEELVVERLLWVDEVGGHRHRLAAAGADVGVERLDAIDAKVRRLFDRAEQAVAAGRLPEAEIIDELIGTGPTGTPAWPILSGSSPLPSKPPEHRPVRRAEGLPQKYFDPPGNDIFMVTRTKRADDPGGWNVEEGDDDPIARQAQQLFYDPVALYRFVLNQMRAEHYFGSVKSAATVLQSGGGNDADQALLLAALFRESGFPARVAWGVQEYRIESLLHHFGVDTPDLLEEVLTRAGIPWTAVASGGQVRAYQLERCWSEVWLPFANFRGVILDASGATWVRLDPQLKLMQSASTRRILDELAFDSEQFLEDYVAGAYCTGDLLQAGACPTAREILIRQVDQYLADGGETLTYAEIAAAREIVAETMPILPASMVGNVVSVTWAGLDYPPEIRHRLRLRAMAGDHLVMDETVAVSELSGREATLWYVPATADDDAIVAAYNDYLWDVPPYLVNVTPQILAEGEELVRGTDGIGMGRPFDLEVGVITPAGQVTTFHNGELAGAPVALAIASGSQGYAITGEEPVNTLEELGRLANDYLDAQARFDREGGTLLGLTLVHPQPSLAWVGGVVEPDGVLGLVQELVWKGLFIDADTRGAEPSAGSAADERSWRLLTGLEASALERQVFEAYGVASVSAEKALILAHEAGVEVHRIDAGNLGALLPLLPYGDHILAEIEAWVLSGGEVRVPASALAYIDWSGVGYVLLDPETNEARYQLAGSLSGGMTAVPLDPDLWTFVSQPVAEDTVDNPDLAAIVEIYDGNFQVATVGETLALAFGNQPLRVRALDRWRRPVIGAIVRFELLAGGGRLVQGDGVTAQLQTNARGITGVWLTLGDSTAANPIRIRTDANELFSTQAGLHVVTASVNGNPLAAPFYEFALPGPISQLLTPYGKQFSGLPNISLSVPLVAIPADQHGNPVSNAEVLFQLAEPVPSDPTQGPVLLSDEEDCTPDVVFAQECGGDGEVSDSGGPNGVSATLVLGPGYETGNPPQPGTYHVTARHTREDGSKLSVDFEAGLESLDVPTGARVGEPLIVLTRRGQPATVVDGEAVSVEAYLPGQEIYPLMVGVALISEQYDVVSCGSSTGYCTEPRGTYVTRRLHPNVPVDDCAGTTGGECQGGELFESATGFFSWFVESKSLKSPMMAKDVTPDGYFVHTIPLPDQPGRYNAYTVLETVTAAVPKRPQDLTLPEAVEPCFGTGGQLCGARLELKTIDPPVDAVAEFLFWALAGSITEPTPVVVLGPDDGTTEVIEFPYTILPADYPAVMTSVLFREGGQLSAVAESDGRGDGVAKLMPGQLFQDAGLEHWVQLGVNSGYRWEPVPGEPTISAAVWFAEQRLPVVQLKITDVRDHENRSVLDEELDVRISGPATVTYQVLAGGVNASLNLTKLQIDYDLATTAHKNFYDVGGTGDTLVTVDADLDPSPDANGEYSFSWSGRDSSSGKRILLGGRYLVTVSGEIVVNGSNITIHDTTPQRIAAPHASNYGTRENDFKSFGFMAEYAEKQQASLRDGSGYVSDLTMVQREGSLPSQALARLRNRDGLFHFRGHGAPGLISFRANPMAPDGGQEGFFITDATAYANYSEYFANPTYTIPPGEVIVLDNVADLDLRDVLLVVLMTCNSGVAAPGSTRTFGKIFNDLGADIAITVPGMLNTDIAFAWQRSFWDWVSHLEVLPHGSQPATIRQACRVAAHQSILDMSMDDYSEDEEWNIRNLTIDTRDDAGTPADEFLYPARYGYRESN